MGHRTLLVVVYLIGLLAYAAVPIESGFYVPGIICAGAALLSALDLNVYRSLLLKFIVPVIGIILITTASIFLTSMAPDRQELRIVGEAQLIYSMWVAFTGYILITRLDGSMVRKICIVMLLLILCGCILELTTNFLAVVNDVRYAIYPPYDVAAPDTRASYLFGGQRPNFFASEPSHLASFVVLLLMGWWIFARSRLDKTVIGVVMLSSILIIRSPIILIALAGFFLVDIYQGQRSFVSALLKMRTVTASMALLAIFAIAVAIPPVTKRVQMIANGKDDSFNIRIVAPIFYAQNVLTESPLFGTGIRGTKTEESMQMYLRSLSDANVNMQRIYRLNADTDVDDQINNNFWLFWSEYGLFGGTILLVILVLLIYKELGKPIVPAILIMLLFAQVMGGVYSIRFFGTVWTIFAFLSIARRQHIISLANRSQPISIVATEV